jgi:hypothetical protein
MMMMMIERYREHYDSSSYQTPLLFFLDVTSQEIRGAPPSRTRRRRIGATAAIYSVICPPPRGMEVRFASRRELEKITTSLCLRDRIADLISSENWDNNG